MKKKNITETKRIEQNYTHTHTDGVYWNYIFSLLGLKLNHTHYTFSLFFIHWIANLLLLLSIQHSFTTIYVWSLVTCQSKIEYRFQHMYSIWKTYCGWMPNDCRVMNVFLLFYFSHSFDCFVTEIGIWIFCSLVKCDSKTKHKKKQKDNS